MLSFSDGDLVAFTYDEGEPLSGNRCAEVLKYNIRNNIH